MRRSIGIAQSLELRPWINRDPAEMSLSGGKNEFSGIAFELVERPLTSSIVNLDDWEIEVSQRSTFVVARGSASTDHVETVGPALQGELARADQAAICVRTVANVRGGRA